MSWFGLGIQGKSVVDQYSSITGYFTGNVISNYIYDKLIKDNSLNLFVRQQAVNSLAFVASPQLQPTSKKISKTILENTCTQEKLKYAVKEFKKRFLSAPMEYTSKMTKLAWYVATRSNGTENGQSPVGPANNGTSRLELFWSFRQQIREGEFSTAVQTAIINSLTPICEEAVQKALVAGTKAAGGKTYDFSVKKACSITVMPLVYTTACMALEALGDYYQVPIAGYMNHLPSSSTILKGSILVHAAQMAGTIWQEMSKPVETAHMDKEDVKNMVFDIVKTSMREKIKNNEMLSCMDLNKTEEDIDHLLKSMISEAVNFYWNDLNQTKVLGLPLVT
jgi:hypothetical protein